MGALIQTLYPPIVTSKIDPATHVSIIALTSTLARILAGSVSDYFAPPAAVEHNSATQASRFHMSRLWTLFLFSAFMLSGQALLAMGVIYAHPQQFWYVSASIGAGYGACFTLAPTIVSVVWGTRNFGTNWGIVTTTPALGATLFGALWGAVYDARADPDTGVCWGSRCARLSFGIMAGSVAVAIVGWAWAWRGPGGWKPRGIVV